MFKLVKNELKVSAVYLVSIMLLRLCWHCELWL